MILLAILLAAIGVGDLWRVHVRRLAGWAPAAAFVVLVAASLLLDLGADSGRVIIVGGALAACWAWTTNTTRWHPWPVVGLGLVCLLLTFSDQPDVAGSPLARWYGDVSVESLHGVGFERFLLAVGVVLFLVESANVVVRLVLASAGPGVIAGAQTLRGGRILGPLERLFVFGLAIGGHLGVLAAVVAAKGILRFPEITRDKEGGQLAEYVLVGSFVSWALALVFVPLF